MSRFRRPASAALSGSKRIRKQATRHAVRSRTRKARLTEIRDSCCSLWSAYPGDVAFGVRPSDSEAFRRTRSPCSASRMRGSSFSRFGSVVSTVAVASSKEHEATDQ
jgi:hypothetical protein